MTDETATGTVDETAPAPAPETISAAPAGIKRVSGSIDTTLATSLFTTAMTNETGAFNGRYYPSTTDAAYIADMARLRKHLRSRLNDTQTVRVVPFVNPDGDGYGFALQVATKRPRKSKK